ncbi:hypothetical protein [Pseudoalteromonas spongiae]|uniref:hypothetical protein n=1 Tax=Pseudoalteromonas spongiae TaxID=298657 RepID=UPI000C2D0E6E|nr:hypothetical protein [Pseudoalteromonas spongiae]
MSNHNLLKDSVELLKKIRLELHDDIDSSKRSKLDKAIEELENNRAKLTNSDILGVIGKFVIFIPAIERILNSLKEL